MMLDESEEEASSSLAEGEMIDNVFEFNNIQIYDVMTHRVDVELINVEGQSGGNHRADSYHRLLPGSRSMKRTRTTSSACFTSRTFS